MDIVHIQQYYYIHIRDKIENTVSMVQGPKTKVLQSHEQLIEGPKPMIKLIPNHMIRISNPVLLKDGEPVMEDDFDQVKLRFGDEEIRTYQNYSEPFPLYPGELEASAIYPAKILSSTQALKLYALRDFYDNYFKVDRIAGQLWVLPGPLVYVDRVEVKVIEKVEATIIGPNQALRLRAKKNYEDFRGVKRTSGEEWLEREFGPYIISAEEEIISLVDAIILSDVVGLHLCAISAYTDFYGIKRFAGQEWIITNETSSTHIPDVYEKVQAKLEKVILNRWQYCIVMDFVGEDGKNLYGQKQLRRGETSFFLKPGEYLKDGTISENKILSDDQTLLLLAKEVYEDKYGVHQPGERWMVYGPLNYVPPIQVEVLEMRCAIPLDDNEGIYVRDIHTGEVKMVTGTTYMLGGHEELWSKNLADDVEILLQNEGTYDSNNKNALLKSLKPRDKSRVVTFMVPHNSVVQIFDYRLKKNYMEFGPSIVKLGPYEQFTVLSLSGGVPKVENKIKTLLLRLGPDFISDSVEVETSDHARLQLLLTFSWKFQFERNNGEDLEKLFQVKDFIGNCCKSVASRIRGIVSSVNFDSFHKDSSNIVQTGVFGKDKTTGKLKKPLVFKVNNFVITNVDIQSQEPVDQKMRFILNESMILSMKTNLMIQESEAKHREERANQEAKGKVERKQIEDETESENKRLVLLRLQAENDQINTTGLSESETVAKCSESEINAEADLEKSKNAIEGYKMKRQAALDKMKIFYVEEIEHLKKMTTLEIEKAENIANSTVEKIDIMVNSIGKDTIIELAKAGPEAQAKLLKSLGVKSLLITDGKSPINLFNTSNGLIGALPNHK
jgi:major vault protein